MERLPDDLIELIISKCGICLLPFTQKKFSRWKTQKPKNTTEIFIQNRITHGDQQTLELLKFLHKYQISDEILILYYLIQEGYNECFKYMYNRDYKDEISDYMYAFEYRFESIYDIAIYYNNAELVEYITYIDIQKNNITVEEYECSHILRQYVSNVANNARVLLMIKNSEEINNFLRIIIDLCDNRIEL